MAALVIQPRGKSSAWPVRTIEGTLAPIARSPPSAPLGGRAAVGGSRTAADARAAPTRYTQDGGDRLTSTPFIPKHVFRREVAVAKSVRPTECKCWTHRRSPDRPSRLPPAGARPPQGGACPILLGSQFGCRAVRRESSQVASGPAVESLAGLASAILPVLLAQSSIAERSHSRDLLGPRSTTGRGMSG
jgi:hypothetical protein